MVFGTDLALDFSTNDIEFSNNNDFELITEEENLIQAVSTRLLTLFGSLRTHENFGSRVYEIIGLPKDETTLNAAGSYVYQALEDEVRIKEVEEITVDFRVIDGNDFLAIFAKFLPIDSDVPLNLIVNVEVAQ